jgi:hypothetical protein
MILSRLFQQVILGCHIRSVNLAVYADDILLLAPTVSALQLLFDLYCRLNVKTTGAFNQSDSSLNVLTLRLVMAMCLLGRAELLSWSNCFKRLVV